MDIKCIRCKGSGMCGRSYCPHIMRSQAIFKVRQDMPSKDLSGPSPAPFVGRYGYPDVNVGLLSPVKPEQPAEIYDAPRVWAGRSFSIPQIVDLRSALVNSRFKANIRQKSSMLDISQEVGIAKRPVDVEMVLKDRPRFRLNTSAISAPMGPNAALEKARITENASVHTAVQKVVDDTDMNATQGLAYLYKKDFDENFLTRAFSVGSFGIGRNRKLVPTRWSITAVDDTLGKDLHKRILDHSHVGEHLSFFGSYLGNYYLVLMIPDCWGYELFETYMPKASWNTSERIDYMTDSEGYSGRKGYAYNCAGGYYSVRLAVLERLAQMRRQASCFVIRVITGEYSAPLGVWVTRQAARKALEEKPLKFASLDLMLHYVSILIKRKFGFDPSLLTSKSVLLKNIRTQRKLFDF